RAYQDKVEETVYETVKEMIMTPLPSSIPFLRRFFPASTVNILPETDWKDIEIGGEYLYFTDKVEERLGVRLADEDWQKMLTVHDTIDLLRQKIQLPTKAS